LDVQLRRAVRSGLAKGVRTSWELLRIIVPVYLGVAIFIRTPLMDWLSVVVEPLMAVFALPAEAAIPVTLGFVSGLYAAIGAVASLSLTAKEILTIAVILSFAHNLFVESAVTHRLGIPFGVVVAMRLGLAIVGGLAIRLIF